ncbi:uncharacterized protein LOC106052698 isoform X4 [Biomphalaria glabrata]|uniref:Uncharacterized protein LOC106052698 isoform X4 n=1 Tax=Biomphalaria glabrata TaxID=6526 RepID=A0A9W2ZCB4_BIOGL|nr:uncharacterized protein LOC106052698 isoform X4 [Biomphalaria glabrata]
MPKHYVDNAFNRSLGRVGMEHGTAVYSRSSGSFSSGLGSSMSSSSDNNYGSYSGSSSNYSNGLSFHVENPSDCYTDSFRQQTTSSRHSDLGSSVSSSGSKTYVDNAYNRSLGRVGLEHGTAVHHRDDSRTGSSSSSRMYADNALNRNLDRVGLELGTAVHHKESSSTSGSSKTYVDNAVNRSLGRVGLEHGTAVQHKENQSSSSSSKTYVDNAVNRSLGRVGLEHGTAVQHKKDTSSSSGSSSHTYVDNAANRKLGRVGLEHGTAVQHKADKSQGSSSSLAAKFDGLSIVEPRRYKDNNLNRKLGRVGKPLGAVRYNPRPIAHTVYVDNDYNRRYNRVGKPLGSVPIPIEDRMYKDTTLNRELGRVGLPWGKGKNKPYAELLNKLRNLNYDDEIPDDIVQFYDQDSDALEAIEAFMAIKEREENVRLWLEEECETTWDAHQHTSKQVIENYKGVVINCSDLIFRNKLGNGNFGKVFLAEWVEGQLVAVKVLKNQSVSKRRLRDFEREILLYCELDHENIVQFLGACTEIPHLAIVMEYMDISLYEALHIKEVDISLDGRSSIMRDVARGLSYLHSKGIAHCDLKSHNVLLNNVPGQNTTDTRFPMIAKLTDFGLSFMKSDSESSSSLSDAVKNIGTPKYSAPEVLRGELLNADAMMKADVYSLGLTIVEILLEEIPFEGLNLTQLQKQVGEKGLKPKVERGNILIPEVKSMLIRCCNRDPDQRPTARELSAFCERYPNVYKKECR